MRRSFVVRWLVVLILLFTFPSAAGSGPVIGEFPPTVSQGKMFHSGSLPSAAVGTPKQGDFVFSDNINQLYVHLDEPGAVTLPTGKTPITADVPIAHGFIVQCGSAMQRGDPVWAVGYLGQGVRTVGQAYSIQDYVGSAVIGVLQKDCASFDLSWVQALGTTMEGDAGALALDTQNGVATAGEPVCAAAAATAGADLVYGWGACLALVNPLYVGTLWRVDDTYGQIYITGTPPSAMPTHHVLHLRGAADWGTTAAGATDGNGANCLDQNTGGLCSAITTWFSIDPNHFLKFDPLSYCVVTNWNATQNVNVRVQIDADDTAAGGWGSEASIPTLVIPATTADYTRTAFAVTAAYKWVNLVRRIRVAVWEAGAETKTGQIACEIAYWN